MECEVAKEYLLNNGAKLLDSSLDSMEIFAISKSPEVLGRKDLILVVVESPPVKYISRFFVSSTDPICLGVYYCDFPINIQEQKYSVPKSLTDKILSFIQEKPLKEYNSLLLQKLTNYNENFKEF